MSLRIPANQQTLTILRLENARGDGIYRSRAFGAQSYHGQWDPQDADATDARPMPYCDGLRHEIDRDRELFGFHDVAQMLAWMYDADERRTQVRNGAVIKVLQVPRTAIELGYSQVVYVKDEAKCIGNLDPLAYIDGEVTELVAQLEHLERQEAQAQEDEEAAKLEEESEKAGLQRVIEAIQGALANSMG